MPGTEPLHIHVVLWALAYNARHRMSTDSQLGWPNYPRCAIGVHGV